MSDTIQTYPPPTELPVIRAGELDGRYLDCTPALSAVDDVLPGINVLSFSLRRADGMASDASDLVISPDWGLAIDTTGRIVVLGLSAPPASAGRFYLLTLTCSKTAGGRVFIRDFCIGVTPILG